MNLVWLLAGIGLLTAGGEILIRGSLAAATRLGVSPLLCGLVIVGFGTSAPELVVSVTAAIERQPDIAIGNVVGSNIGNGLLILGVCGLIRPLYVRPLALFRDATTGIAASILFLLLAAGSALGRFDSVILLSAFVLYLGWAYWSERYHSAPSAQVHEAEAQEISALPNSVFWTVASVIGGLMLLIGGSRVLLAGAVGISEDIGVSEAAIGLILVAVGTSLPELTISVLATLRNHIDVAVGNVLGSNIFNLLGILGVSALLQPLPIHDRILQFDQWVLLGSSILVLLLLYTAKRLARWEGGILLAGYAGYCLLSFTTYSG
ncbi:MAG: calcium/sodium antiporter [Woeseiaceae bacterium]|nr:calcium/sodium antiporter [Woeseiaceae bacterium]